MKTIIATVLLLVGVGAFAQVPVADPTSLAEEMRQTAEMLRQTQAMYQQYETMRRQLEQLTGNRGLASILNNPMLRGHLPEDVNRVYSATNSARYGDVAGALDQIARTEALTGTPQERRVVIERRELRSAHMDRAMAMEAYKGEAAELRNIDLQIEQIKTTQDPKAIAEVQASLAATQARIAARSNQIQLLAWASQNEQRLVEAQGRAMERDILDPSRTGMPKVRLWN